MIPDTSRQCVCSTYILKKNCNTLIHRYRSYRKALPATLKRLQRKCVAVKKRKVVERITNGATVKTNTHFTFNTNPVVVYL